VFLALPEICEQHGYKKNCGGTITEEERNFVWVQLKYVFFWKSTVMEVRFCVCVYVRTYFAYTALDTHSM